MGKGGLTPAALSPEAHKKTGHVGVPHSAGFAIPSSRGVGSSRSVAGCTRASLVILLRAEGLECLPDCPPVDRLASILHCAGPQELASWRFEASERSTVSRAASWKRC